MYARCPNCAAALPLSPALLAESGGSVRCGGCGRTFSALSSLFEDFPGQDDEPLPAGRTPPLVQPRADSREAGSETEGPPEPGPRLKLDLTPPPPPGWARVFWPALGAALLIALAVQLFGPEPWRVSGLPGLAGQGAPQAPPDPAAAIQVRSRDMHPHPVRDDAVVISAVLVNRTRTTVPYPLVEVVLFDASQQVIGQRRLAPADYLAEGEGGDGGLRPGVLFPLVLELVTEGSTPTGFGFSFYSALLPGAN